MSDFAHCNRKLKWCAGPSLQIAHQQAWIGWYDSGSAELFCGRRVPDIQVVVQRGRREPELPGCEISLHRIKPMKNRILMVVLSIASTAAAGCAGLDHHSSITEP